MSKSEIAKQQSAQTFYVSSRGKVHSEKCRHFRPDKQGWQQLESLRDGVSQGFEFCRICCPSLEEISQQPSPVISTSENLPEIASVSIVSEKEEGKSLASDVTPNCDQTQQVSQASTTESAVSVSVDDRRNTRKNRTKASQDKNKNQPLDKSEKKRYKILAGNGCHQAIAEVQGILLKPSELGSKFTLILPDGTELQASFRNSRLKWIACNKEEILGLHWFRGYPKMKDDQLVCFQIIAWDGNMPSNERGWETWEFTGLWTPQKNLTVQRSMGIKEIRQEAKETGFIKKFKYTFTNTQEWVANKKLWIGYVYKLLCRREGNKLKIQKVIPVACPRIKPSPKGKSSAKFLPKKGAKPELDESKN
jgi:hypothetical protein